MTKKCSNMATKAKEWNSKVNKFHNICHNIYLILGLIGFIMILASIVIHAIVFRTLFIPFADVSPFLSLAVLFINVRWSFDIAIYVKMRKTLASNKHYRGLLWWSSK